MKKIPYGRQSIDQKDIDAVVETLQSDFLTQGPKVAEFEKEFAKYVGSKYSVAVNNATSGLHLSVLALGLEAGDRVITTPITFASSANCVEFCGGEVWFADIDPETYLISIESVQKLIESKPKGFFKGVIPVNFGGLPVDLEKLSSLCKEHGLWIVEDAAHSPGGSIKDSQSVVQKCGGGVYNELSVFSFHPVKHIACGEGGMVTTNSEELYKKVNLLRTHGITKENMEEDHGSWYYEMQELGYNYRLTDIQSALGISQLAKNNKGVERRNEIADMYKKAFQDKVKFQTVAEGSYNAYHLFVIEVENRKDLYDQLRTQGILSQIHYIPVHLLPYYKKKGWKKGDFPNAENYYDHCLSLPMYPSLTNEEVNFIIEKVFQFIG